MSTTATVLHRLLLLGLCVGAGSIIGFVGQRLSGDSRWFLAIPALVLGAWFFVADPTECTPPAGRSFRDGSDFE